LVATPDKNPCNADRCPGAAFSVLRPAVCLSDHIIQKLGLRFPQQGVR
jgi:hypothetical protein